MPRHFDYTGLRNGRLVVIERASRRGFLRCRCDCGAEPEVSQTAIRRTRSCGCLLRDWLKSSKTTHGKAGSGQNRSRVYRIWNAMKQRCQNPNQPHYARYGGRGITVCEAWQKFDAFYADMGDPPSDSHSIDRIDNDSGYEPSNCRWATALEQRHNQRR